MEPVFYKFQCGSNRAFYSLPMPELPFIVHPEKIRWVCWHWVTLVKNAALAQGIDVYENLLDVIAYKLEDGTWKTFFRIDEQDEGYTDEKGVALPKETMEKIVTQVLPSLTWDLSNPNLFRFAP